MTAATVATVRPVVHHFRRPAGRLVDLLLPSLPPLALPLGPPPAPPRRPAGRLVALLLPSLLPPAIRLGPPNAPVRDGGGSVWESNPPPTCLEPDAGFEVREAHRDPIRLRFC